MDECDPGAPLDFVGEASAHRYADFSHGAKGTAPGCAHSVKAQRYQARLDLKTTGA